MLLSCTNNKLAVFFVIFEAELIFLNPWALIQALVEASAGDLLSVKATPFLADSRRAVARSLPLWPCT